MINFAPLVRASTATGPSVIQKQKASRNGWLRGLYLYVKELVLPCQRPNRLAALVIQNK
jgi:hypothetical protein